MAFKFAATSKVTGSKVDPTNFERTQPFSAFGWFNFGATSQAALVGHLAVTTFQGWELDIGDSTHLFFYIINNFGTNGLEVHAVVPTINTGTWYHCGCTYTGNSNVSGQSIYFSGISRSTTTSQNTLSATIKNSIPLVIANRNDNSAQLAGTVSDVAVWNCVLAQSEITALATNVLRPGQIRPQNLVSYLDFDGLLDGGIANDLSPWKNNGIKTGSTLANDPPLLARRGPPELWRMMGKTAVVSAIRARRTLSLVGTHAGGRQMQIDGS